jgi:hypothetical protein
MSRVLFVNVDSNKIPPLPLLKLSTWHKARGDVVGFNIENPDKVYISCIFTKNAAQARGISKLYPDAEIDIGGSGIDLTKQLPAEIENLKPDYDLYPSEYSQGFTTRGCDRRCPFCIVFQKEGHIHVRQLPEEFHDDRFNTCMIMDNNLLQAPRYWVHKVLRWFPENGVKMLSPQGWDARLLTEEYAGMLKDIKHPKGIHFAWDNLRDEPAVVNAIKLLKDAGFNLKHDVSFYVLAGFAMVGGKPIQIPLQPSDIYRCYRLKEMGVNAFVMPYHKKDKGINALAKWANRRWAYWSGQFTYGDYVIETIAPMEST